MHNDTTDELTEIIIGLLRMDTRKTAEIQELRHEVELLHARTQEPDQGERIKNYCEVINILQETITEQRKIMQSYEATIALAEEDNEAQAEKIITLHNLLEDYARQITALKKQQGLT